MRRLLAFCLFVIVVSPGQKAPVDMAERFIGTWALVSYELRVPSGAITKPFGDHPIGRILYQKGGQMSAQLMTGATAPFASPDPLKATRDETDRAWRNYIGYWGTFRVDTRARTIVHKVEGGWFPNWIGEDQVRAFRFTEDSLVLEADSPAWHATLVWRKMSDRRQ